MLIWQDPDGTHVGYLDPRELADRYALDGHQQTLERQAAVLTKLATAAASERSAARTGRSRADGRSARPGCRSASALDLPSSHNAHPAGRLAHLPCADSRRCLLPPANGIGVASLDLRGQQVEVELFGSSG